MLLAGHKCGTEVRYGAIVNIKDSFGWNLGVHNKSVTETVGKG